MKLKFLWVKGLKLKLRKGVLLSYTFPLPITKMHTLHVLWQFVSIERTPPLPVTIPKSKKQETGLFSGIYVLEKPNADK